MQQKKLFFILLLSIFTFSANAQESPVFPQTGTYSVQLGIGEFPKPFNKIVIAENTFYTLNDEQVLRYYRIVSQNGTNYEIEQYFSTDDYPKRDRERFSINITNVTETTYHISLQLLNGETDQIHLSKIN